MHTPLYQGNSSAGLAGYTQVTPQRNYEPNLGATVATPNSEIGAQLLAVSEGLIALRDLHVELRSRLATISASEPIEGKGNTNTQRPPEIVTYSALGQALQGLSHTVDEERARLRSMIDLLQL